VISASYKVAGVNSLATHRHESFHLGSVGVRSEVVQVNHLQYI